MMKRSTPQRRGGWFAGLVAATLIATAGCAPTAAAPAVAPSPVPRVVGLPEVPTVTGDLMIDVVYPGEGAAIAVRDSTFLFGSTGRGDAVLVINGDTVEVAPNGAWLAYLPIPTDGVYTLVASAGQQTVSATRQVRVPGPPVQEDGTLRILEGSISPSGPVTGVRGERVEVRFRGSSGATASLILPGGEVIPLAEQQAIDQTTGFMLDVSQATQGLSDYVGTLTLDRPMASMEARGSLPVLVTEAAYLDSVDEQGGTSPVVELGTAFEAVQFTLPIALAVLEPGAPRIAIAATQRPDGTVIGRRAPGADQAWDFFWPNGTMLRLDGEIEGYFRVRLTEEITAWVLRDDVMLLPEARGAARGFVGPSIQLRPTHSGVDIRFGMSDRLPFRVVPDERGFAVEFYGAVGRPAYVGYGATDDFVHRVSWEQTSDEVYRFEIDLNQRLWGYRYRWEGSSLIVELRRPPVVDPAAPLRGLRVAIDAGHRGSAGDIGAIGPTRLTEAEANLAVTQRLAPMLAAAGAEVIEIRPDTSIVPLIERPLMADRADAHLFVSVHFNAFPDGVNPFESHGTLNLFYWPFSLGFARHLQAELLASFGLPDRGVRFQNLAIPRTTWMPSVLTETMYMMFPQQEAALRDPGVLERIAESHMRGMESFLRDVAAPDDGG